MNAQLQPGVVSPEEFHEFEENSDAKHEYWNGVVVERALASEVHTIIGGNIACATRNALRGKQCCARSSEQMVRIESANAEYYPDALIFCPPGRFAGKDDRVLLNPKVIFEVLSPSTESKDCGSKFRVYRACESITDYVLVSQDRVLVEHFQRVEGGWFLRSFNSLEDSLQFPDCEVALPLSEIYDELELPSALLLLEEMNQNLEE